MNEAAAAGHDEAVAGPSSSQLRDVASSSAVTPTPQPSVHPPGPSTTTGVRICRICLEEEDSVASSSSAEGVEAPTDVLIQPCACKGSHGWVHRSCLRTWRHAGHNSSASRRCPVCAQEYDRQALDTVSCSSVGSTSAELLAMREREIALIVATMDMQQQQQQRAGGGRGEARARADATYEAPVMAMLHPKPSAIISVFGTTGVLLLIAVLLGWMRGDQDLEEWIQSTLLTVVVVCCSPVAILVAGQQGGLSHVVHYPRQNTA